MKIGDILILKEDISLGPYHFKKSNKFEVVFIGQSTNGVYAKSLHNNKIIFINKIDIENFITLLEYRGDRIKELGIDIRNEE